MTTKCFLTAWVCREEIKFGEELKNLEQTGLRTFRIRTTTHRRLRQLRHNILYPGGQFFLDNFSTSPILGGDFVSGNLIAYFVSH